MVTVKGVHVKAIVILTRVRWYLASSFSCRQLFGLGPRPMPDRAEPAVMIETTGLIP
jgi:hypothetical protein